MGRPINTDYYGLEDRRMDYEAPWISISGAIGAGRRILTDFRGRFCVLGFGSVASAFVATLCDMYKVPQQRLIVLSQDLDVYARVAQDYPGVTYIQVTLTARNYAAVLDKYTQPGDFLLNLAVGVGSVELVQYCQANDMCYIDTCIEPMGAPWGDTTVPLAERTNYHLREAMLSFRRSQQAQHAQHTKEEQGPEQMSGGRGLPTAVLVSGANPGIVQHLLKAALWKLAQDTGCTLGSPPRTSPQWAALAAELGVKVIHIAECDTQHLKPAAAAQLSPAHFVNTWSVDGFVEEGIQPAELGWGSHERCLPPAGVHHEQGCKAAIYLAHPSMSTRVRSWTPISGEQAARLITHHESIEIADYLTLKAAASQLSKLVLEAGPAGQVVANGRTVAGAACQVVANGHAAAGAICQVVANGHTAAGAKVPEDEEVVYRPTVHYAYRPCDEAEVSLGRVEAAGYALPAAQHIMQQQEIAPGGVDQLGVLLMGHPAGALWFGTTVSVEDVLQLCRHLTPTSAQVVAGLLASLCWAIQHPKQGILEPMDIPDYEHILYLASPLLGTIKGVYTSWTPLQSAQRVAGLYGAEVAGEHGAKADVKDPWQFTNFLMV